MNSNSFIRVQKKYFFKFEFGKMIEFKFEFAALIAIITILQSYLQLKIYSTSLYAKFPLTQNFLCSLKTVET